MEDEYERDAIKKTHSARSWPPPSMSQDGILGGWPIRPGVDEPVAGPEL